MEVEAKNGGTQQENYGKMVVLPGKTMEKWWCYQEKYGKMVVLPSNNGDSCGFHRRDFTKNNDVLTNQDWNFIVMDKDIERTNRDFDLTKVNQRDSPSVII